MPPFPNRGQKRDNLPMDRTNTPLPSSVHSRDLFTATAIYGVILIAFWLVAGHISLGARIGHMGSTFAAFSLVFAPYWFFGFGAAEALQRALDGRASRVFAPALLVVPYLVYALPRGEFRWAYFFVFLALPMGISALFAFQPPVQTGPAGPRLGWQDLAALAAVGLPVEFNWMGGAFPHDGLSALPKLLLVDAGLYAFLVVRQLEGVGYDFRPRMRDLLTGLRELVFFAPIVIVLGMGLQFIRPHAGLPRAATALQGLLVTFFFVAVPEELFFRGWLQNLLEGRLGRHRALGVAAAIFGLSHYNKPLPFNWRYVLLATLAGVFYGRAWREQRRLLPSAITHTLVDVLWTLWFR